MPISAPPLRRVRPPRCREYSLSLYGHCLAAGDLRALDVARRIDIRDNDDAGRLVTAAAIVEGQQLIVIVTPISLPAFTSFVADELFASRPRFAGELRPVSIAHRRGRRQPDHAFCHI